MLRVRRIGCRAIAAFLFLAVFVAVPASRTWATMPRATGDLDPEVRRAFAAGLFEVPARTAAPSISSATSLQALWVVPVVMVSYADDTLQYSSAGFDSALFDTTGVTPTGSVFDYYQWVSGGRVTVHGRVVARVRLGHPRAYYGGNGYGLTYNSTPNNTYGALYDALTLCQEFVDWSEFDQDRDGYVDMLWFLHAGRAGEMSFDRNDLWSFTSRMSIGWRNGNVFTTQQTIPGAPGIHYKIDRFSVVPELSGIRAGMRAEIGVFCHEFGHALGLPDLYDTSTLGGLGGNVGPGYWSLMSTGGYGGNGSSPEYPTHVGAWAANLLGWLTPIRPTRDTTMTLSPLSQSGNVVEFWFQGESAPEHFLLECRAREGFDRTLNNEGLLITHVDEAAIGARLGANQVNAGPTPGLWLVEADGDSDLVLGRNRGDAYDPFPGLSNNRSFSESTVPPAVTFSGATPGISLSNIQRQGQNVRFDLQVRPPGWLPAEDQTRGEFSPVGSLSAAPTALRDAHGNLHQVWSEIVNGRSQVVLHSQTGGLWRDPEVLTDSPSGALDPCIARIGDTDLAVAWSDLRGGRTRVYFRARVLGTWSDERLVGDLPGENRAPTIGVDQQGRVHLAWLNLLDDVPTIYFTRFLYFAPWGQAYAVTQPGDAPAPPVLAVARNGTSHLVWAERGVSPTRLYFRRFQPDSGFSPRWPLTPYPSGSQGPVTAIADSAGTLHVVWVLNTLATREIRYQRRIVAATPSPRDSTIERRSAYVDQPSLGTDPSGTVHLVYSSAPTGVPQIFYKRWRPVLGWDLTSTDLTSPADGGSSTPAVLPTRPGTVTVLYTGYPVDRARFMERRRQIEPPQVLAVSEREPDARGVEFRGPNPLRAGDSFELRWLEPSGEAPTAADLFDVSGRRVASAPARALGPARVARFDGPRTADLASGVYFARPRGRDGAGHRLVLLR